LEHWSIIEEKNLAVGFRRRKISCHSRPRTLRSETMAAEEDIQEREGVRDPDSILT